MNALVCCVVANLHDEIIASRDHILFRVANENADADLDENIYQTVGIIVKQATTDIGITALGFFKISKGALLMTYSFVITYVVILLQSPLNSSGRVHLNNTTDY
uniref:Gustatory receptor n=1 Tax=Plectus sambesii TaxID=2011161 RepID=A0A914VAC5_9BILA